MQAGDRQGFYEVLGVSRTASADELRRAFRERAKRFHPDRAGDGADEASFLRLREAFETLRDPQRRMHYDAEGLEDDDGEGLAGAEGQARSTDPHRSGRGPLARWRRGGRRAAIVMVVLAALPVLGLVLLAPVWARLGRPDAWLAELGDQLPPPEYPALLPEPSAVYRSELVFPRGSAELVAAHGERAASVARGLRDTIAGLPPNGAWTVTIAGHSPHFAYPAGNTANHWQLTIRRLAAAGEFLTRQGVPDARIAAQFRAGTALDTLPPSVPEAIQLTLWCCEAAATR